MDMQLSHENYSQTKLKYRILARIALLFSYPLTKTSPYKIESIINRFNSNKAIATEREVILARDAICSVSRKCRNQDGCVKRSLAVIVFLILLDKRASWCTGFSMNPFRSHAWVELNGIPIKELEEIGKYEKVVKTKDDAVVEKRKAQFIDFSETNDGGTNVKFRDLLSLIENKRKYFIVVFILGLLSAVLTLLQPEVLSKVISQRNIDIFHNSNILTLITLIIVSTIISSLQYYFLQLMGEGAVFQSRKKLISHILKLPIFKYNDLSAGDLISRFSSDTSRLRLGIVQSTVALTSGILLSVGAILGLFLKDTFLALVTLITISISFVFVIFMSNAIQQASYEAHQGLGQVTAFLNKLILGIRTIRSTNETDNELAKILNETIRVKKLGVNVAKIQSVMTPVSNLSLQACGLVILGVGGFRVSNAQMSIESLTSFILLMYIAITPIGQIFSAITSISEAMGALSRITEITELPLEDDNDISVNRTVIAKTDSAITFDNVSFTYDTYQFNDETQSSTYVLKDVSFSINDGSYTSIVGPSGAGKSTLLYIIERFYDISSGNITVFGRNFRSMTREELRSQIAYVEQNSPLIAGTIFENLKLGNGNVTEDECYQSLKNVGLTHLIERESDGLHSQIGEGGMKLSGGEKQRLAMARAMLSKSKILLLDELTSNLDSLSEKMMKRAINTMRGKKTIIMVAHRLSTILYSDQILVLEHGRLVGKGTHEELLASVPLYRELAKEQFLI